MIPLLKPIFQGALAPIGEGLRCAPEWPIDAVPVAELLAQPAQLHETVTRYGRHLGVTGTDLRAVASAWSVGYLQVLLAPVVAAASLLQHGFPVRADQMAVTLNAHGQPQQFHLLHTGKAMPGASTAARFDTLVWQHLEPLFVALAQCTRLPKKIPWGNAARHLNGVFEQALALTGQAPAIVRDRDSLLSQPDWPSRPGNPLHASPRQVTRLQQGRRTVCTAHRHCCLLHRLPGESYCSTCPLDPGSP